MASASAATASSGRDFEHHPEGGMAGTRRRRRCRDRTPALSAALHGRWTRQSSPRRARDVSSAPPSIASTAPTGRIRSAPEVSPAASGWSMPTSPTSTTAFLSAPKSSCGRNRNCRRGFGSPLRSFSRFSARHNHAYISWRPPDRARGRRAGRGSCHHLRILRHAHPEADDPARRGAVRRQHRSAGVLDSR